MKWLAAIAAVLAIVALALVGFGTPLATPLLACLDCDQVLAGDVDLDVLLAEVLPAPELEELAAPDLEPCAPERVNCLEPAEPARAPEGHDLNFLATRTRDLGFLNAG